MTSFIDFHAHILPCDHGSDSVEMSLRQLSRAKEAGVSEIIATPHFYADQQHLSSFLAQRKQAYDAVCAGAASAPRLRLGAEVLLCEGLENLKGVESLCVEDTNVLLLEMPFSGMNERLLDSLYRLQSMNGLRVVLAHIDRYDSETVMEALETGAQAQINAGSICALSKRKRCLKWIADGVVDAIGSDTHKDDDGYRKYQKAMKLLGRYAEGVMLRTRGLIRGEKTVHLL